MPGRSEGKKRLCVGNQGRVEGGETMDGMYCIIEESIFNKKPTKTFKKLFRMFQEEKRNFL